MPGSKSLNQSVMYGCGGEVETKAPNTEALIYGIFLILQAILSTFGNTLVCLAIIRVPNLRTLSNSLILSLAITDLLTPLTRVIYVAISTLKGVWIFGCSWCTLSSVLGIFLCGSSILHLCAISVERFITIKWPLEYKNIITKSRVIVVITNIWIASLVFSLFPYFGIVHHTFNADILDCELSLEEKPKLAVLLAVFFFLLPFTIISITYFYIFKEVHRQTRKISIIQTQKELTRRKSFGTKLRINYILKTQLKAVRVIVVVVGVFFVFWLPYFLFTCYRAYKPHDISGTLQRMSFATAYTNSSCNWIIYSVMNRQIRDAFKKILCDFSLPSPAWRQTGQTGSGRKTSYNMRFNNNVCPEPENSPSSSGSMTNQEK